MSREMSECAGGGFMVICKRMWGSAIESAGVSRQSQPRKLTPPNIDHRRLYVSFSESARGVSTFGEIL